MSLVACTSMAASIVCMNLYQWPIAGEVVVFPQFLWMLLIISGNVSLAFRQKLLMGTIALATAVTVASLSPLVELMDNFPLLLCASAVFALFHYYSEKYEGHTDSAKTASIVLAGALVYHFTSQLAKMRTISGYTVEGGYSILQAGFFASVGLAAAGAFQKQIYVTNELEEIVAERTKEIAKQAKELHMVGLAVEASETAIAIVDSNQLVEWCNVAFDRLFPQQKIIGRSLCDIVVSKNGKNVQAMKSAFDVTSSSLTEITVQEDVFSLEVTPVPPSVLPGTVKDKLKELEPLVAPTQSTRYLVTLKDITAQRARERAEKHAQKEAIHKQAMQQSMETLSHELRTPLQAIMGMTSLLLDSDELTIAEAKESMSMVMVSSRLLLTLINNLLDVRKCDAKLMNEFQLSSVPLLKSVQDAVDFCRPLGTVTNVSLNLSVDAFGQKALVRMNHIRFQQVVINLLSNAIKYTQPSSTVDIYATVMKMKDVRAVMRTALVCGLSVTDAAPIADDALVAVVSVEDSGSGISTSKLNQVFVKFSQSLSRESVSHVLGASQVAQPAGTGLGLNLCLKFVKRMNGNIWVDENPEGGACFSFYLPCCTQEVDLDGEGCDLNAQSSSMKTFHRSLNTSEVNGAIADYRVMIVDDTAINLKVLDRMLRRVGVNNVNCVESGAKALEALEIEEFDLVLTDVQMPGMSGPELSENIRGRKDLCCSPMVVGLTAETSDSIQGRCSESGMSYLLHKPITTAELQAFFNDVLHGKIKKETYTPTHGA